MCGEDFELSERSLSTLLVVPSVVCLLVLEKQRCADSELELPECFDDSDYDGNFKISQRNNYIAQFLTDAKFELGDEIDSD